jgi:tyrosine-protein kinase Etk/Wzc
VIIDCPPVLAASESLVLAAMADATLVCVLRDVSRIDQIKKAYGRLLLSGAKPLGLVLNGVPTKSYAYHYGSYAYANR